MANFWENIARYPKFFISSVIGLVIIITSPIRKLNKNLNGRIIFVISSILGFTIIMQIFFLMLGIEF
jgi:hypothetical protein